MKIGRDHFKPHENEAEAQTASSLPRAPSKQGCTSGQETPIQTINAPGPDTVALQSDPSIFVLWGQGGRWTPPAMHLHPSARLNVSKPCVIEGASSYALASKSTPQHR